MVLTAVATEAKARAARDAGCPLDQLDNFRAGLYVPQPKQLLFHAAARRADNPDGPTEILVGGARGGAKSHGVMAQVVLDDCIRVPGLRWLYLRNIQRSAHEAFEALIEKLMPVTPHTYVRNEGLLRMPNGSRIICGGFRNESDIDKYIGLEYDGAVIEEVTTIAPSKLEMIYGSIRTSRDDWRPRKYLSTNPGGVGHQYIKQRFVLPSSANNPGVCYIPATYRDNVFLDAAYIQYLEGLTGILGAMWRDGDWNVAAGMAFPDFDISRHVVKPFLVPDNWPKVRAHDYGFVHPAFTLWRAKEPSTGRIFIYRENYARYLSEEFQARAILDLTPEREHITNTYASPDMWEHKAGKNQVVTTRAQEFMDEGVHVTPADNSRINGAAKIHNLLADLPDGKPALQITDNCPLLIECMQAMLSDPSNPEDVLKQDADPETGSGGDDAYDALRYLLTDATNKPVVRHTRQPLPIQHLVGRRK